MNWRVGRARFDILGIIDPELPPRALKKMINDVAKFHGTTTECVRVAAYYERKARGMVRTPWTPDALAYLRTSAGKVKVVVMARHLNRTSRSVQAMMSKLRLTGINVRVPLKDRSI